MGDSGDVAVADAPAPASAATSTTAAAAAAAAAASMPPTRKGPATATTVMPRKRGRQASVDAAAASSPATTVTARVQKRAKNTDAPPTPTTTTTTTASAAIADSGDEATDAPAKKVGRPKKKKADKVEDSASDGEGGGDTAVADAPPKKRAPRRARAAVMPVVAAAAAKPDETREVLKILQAPARELSDRALDHLIPLIMKSTRTPSYMSRQGDDDGDEGAVAAAATAASLYASDNDAGRKILVLSSVNMRALLAGYYHKRPDVNKDTVHKKLGTTRAEADAADLIVMMLHGPMTEEQMSARRLYGATIADTSGYHWSTVAWSRKTNVAYHYESKHPLNEDCCVEALGVLRALGVLPDDAHDLATPAFFPQQKDYWECGYYALVALLILAEKPTAAPITEADVETYAPFFETITSASNCFIKQRLSGLLHASRYAALAR